MPDKNDTTCTVYIEHQTDGLIIAEGYTEFGLIHIEERGWALEAPEKDNLFRRPRVGSPPVLVGQVYHLKDEPTDPLRNQRVMQHILRAAYSKAHGGTLREQLQDRKNKRLVNMVAMLVGAVIFIVGMFANSGMFAPDINVYPSPPAAQAAREWGSSLALVSGQTV